MRQYICASTRVRFVASCCLPLCGFFGTASTLSAQNAGVAWWRFDEAAGQTITDSSGAANNGFLGNSPAIDVDDPLRVSPGRLGPSALAFSPQNFVQIPDHASLEPAQVSVQAWVQSAVAPADFAYIVGKGASDCVSASYALYTGAEVARHSILQRRQALYSRPPYLPPPSGTAHGATSLALMTAQRFDYSWMACKSGAALPPAARRSNITCRTPTIS